MNVKSSRLHLVVLIAFIVITLVMTYPLVLRPGSTIRGFGDPLLNAWILAWDVEQLSNGNVSGFFDGNIFFPNHRTLAYSEHLFTQSLVVAVPLLLSANPVLAHNLVTLFAFLSSAFGMYLLARYLTSNPVAGVVAGIVYGFSPFMFDHLHHLQVLTAGGIPLAFLFLARFFALERWRDLAWLGLFTVLQMLANGYYAVYLAFFIALTVCYHVLAAGKLWDRGFLIKLAVLAVGVVVLAGPFMYQYVALQHEMGFQRSMGSYARITSFLGTPSFNRLYGGVFPGHPEARLFPGFAACVLAVFGVALAVRGRDRQAPGTTRFAGKTVSLATVFNGVILLFGAVMAAVLVFDRLNLSTSSFAKPLVVISVMLALRAVLDPPFRKRWFPPLSTERRWLFFHLFILGFAVLASFGNSINGPYQLLYDHVPGFNGIRAVARIHIISLNSLAVLTAFGVAGVLASPRRWIRRAAVVGIPLVMLVEYFSAPIPLTPAPGKDELPTVYRWLADQRSDVPILELPLVSTRRPKNRMEILRVYFSTLHWRPMINGYSGFFPPVYIELRRRWREMEPGQVIRDARSLGVRQVIVHRDLFEEASLDRTREALRELVPEAARLIELEGAEVWDLAPGGSAVPIADSTGGDRLSSADWRASANVHHDQAGLAIDGDRSTRWHSGPQRPGTMLTVDLGSVQPIRRVELALGDHRRDFPRGLLVELSTGIGPWRVVASEQLDLLPIGAFLQPRNFAVTVNFEPSEARYVRLTCTARHDNHSWSIHEITMW